MKRRILSIITALALCLSLYPAGAFAAEADLASGGSVSYVDENGNSVQSPDTCTLITEEMGGSGTELPGGWYVAEGAVSIAGLLTFGGDTCLILADGCSLTARIYVKGDLTIYAQSTGSGGLISEYDMGCDYAINSTGTITINGGNISAAGSSCAAIGGAEIGQKGTVVINGGTVNASTVGGGKCGAAIGGAAGGDGVVTINGGTVNASSTLESAIDSGVHDSSAAAIGGGYFFSPTMVDDLVAKSGKGTVTVTGGRVYAANNSRYMATVGGDGGSVRISGGIVAATQRGGETAFSSPSPFENAIVFVNGAGTVYGNVELKEDIGLGTDDMSTLHIPYGANITGSGRITVLSAGGVGNYFTTENLTEDRIRIPDSLDSSMTEEEIANALRIENLTICGAECAVKGWTCVVTKNDDGSCTAVYTLSGSNTTVTKDFEVCVLTRETAWYRDENGDEQEVEAIVITGDYSDRREVLSDGWYVVKDIASRKVLDVTGSANVILSDGCSLTSGMYAEKSLSVYGQSDSSGTWNLEPSSFKRNDFLVIINYGITCLDQLTVYGGNLISKGVANEGVFTISGGTLNVSHDDSGKLFSGSGRYQTTLLKEEMIFVPKDLRDNGEDQTETIRERVSAGLTISGQFFEVTGWAGPIVTKTGEGTNQYTVAYQKDAGSGTEVSVTLTLPREVTYLGVDGTVKTAQCKPLTGELSDALEPGWYVLRGNATGSLAIAGIIPIIGAPSDSDTSADGGSVHLILEDGCQFTGTVSKAGDGSSLRLIVYAQSTGAGMGRITAKGGISLETSGYLTVNGGRITACGTTAGIDMGNMSTLTVNGGIVDAEGGAAAIQTGMFSSVERNGGIVFENGMGTVYGDVELGEGETDIPEGYSLRIPAGASLSGSGVLTGGGTWTIETATADMISVPENLTATGEDMAEEIGKLSSFSGRTRICGQSFTVNTEGWVQSVVKVSDEEYTVTYVKGDQTVSRTVRLSACRHEGCVYTHITGTETHAMVCGACGTREEQECAVTWTEKNRDGHGGKCALCSESYFEDHVFGDWDDGGLRACAGCGYEQSAVAKVVTGSSTAYVGDLDDAFTEQNRGAAITLLADVERTSGLEINIDCTLDLGGHSIRETGSGINGCVRIGNCNVTIRGEGSVTSESGDALMVDKGAVNLAGGTFSSGGEWTNAVYINMGSLSVTGENVNIAHTGNGYGLYINPGSSVQLSSGTYSSKANAAIYTAAIPGDTAPALSELLANAGGSGTRYAYYSNGKLLTDNLILMGSKISGTVTVKACSHAYKYGHTEGATTHSQTCPACGDAKTSEKCSFDGNGNCPCGAVVAVTLPSDLNLTYTGAAQEPGVTVMVDGKTTLMKDTDYSVAYGNHTSAGNTAKVVVTGMTFTGTVEKTFTIHPALLRIKAGDQVITYGGSIAQGTGQVTVAGLCAGDRLNGVTLTASTADVPGGTIEPSAAQIQNAAGADVTASYDITYETGILTVNRAAGTLTVAETSVSRKFGDPEFSLASGCSTNGDGRISYASSDEDVVSVSADGDVFIKGAGTAVITVSLAEGVNYTGGVKETVTVTVGKADAPAGQETRKYTYINGSNGAVAIDVAGKFPADRGAAKYTVTATDGNSILSDVSVEENGTLWYTVAGNKTAGDTASVTVTAEMANYNDATYTVDIVLVVKKIVEPQGGSVSIKGSNLLTYGQAVSDLELDSVVFVEQGTDVEVKGRLAWKNPDAVPAVADGTAEWIFTPDDSSEYEGLSGSVAVAVVKAAPDVEIPQAAAVTYNPSGELGSVALSGGSATWTVGGSRVDVEGSWSWRDVSAVPAVGNSGYTAVFTPEDTANYNTVEKTVAVAVAKAEPYLAAPPAAAPITYGDALDASVLTGGAAQYGKDDNTVVPGSFAWKDGAIKPAVSDSGSTGYAVVFLPADGVNYDSVETVVTLIIEQAENAPGMPSQTMNVAGKYGKVGDVPLSEGWQWQETDRDIVLETGVPVTATAVYTGEDRENYRNVTVDIAVTRLDCGHEKTERRGVVIATCQKKGYSGDTYCVDCGELLARGTETGMADHSGGTATCVSGKICTVCGTEYGPKDSAGHSYRAKETKAATCTENGVITYRCSCGDSYTQDTAALGHDYRGEVTKEPTVSSEGVMTYACSRCGDAYTKRLDRLESPSGPGNRPESGKPFIRNDSNKNGWEIIREEADKAADGSTVTVDMNGAVVVPADVLETIRARDVTIVFDMGNAVIWSVNGKSVKEADLDDIDFSVQTGTERIPEKVVNQVGGDRYSRQFSLTHEGEFGFTAVLFLCLGEENAGLTARLYYYHEESGEPELAGTAEITADGRAEFAFTHASDYVVVVDRREGASPEEESTAQASAGTAAGSEESSGAGTENGERSPQTGEPYRPWLFLAAGALGIFTGIGVCFAAQRKREEDK